MKKTIAIALLVSILAGCTSSTEHGPCIGAFDEKNPKLEYKVSAWNAALAILFFGLVLPPVFVVVDETFCPVGKKP